jgi:hypothetical protein
LATQNRQILLLGYLERRIVVYLAVLKLMPLLWWKSVTMPELELWAMLQKIDEQEQILSAISLSKTWF